MTPASAEDIPRSTLPDSAPSLPKAEAGHPNLPFWDNLKPCSVNQDKRNRYSGARRLEEVTLSQFERSAGHSAAELEEREAALCLSVIRHLPSAWKPGCSPLGRKALQESKSRDSNVRWGQESRARESQAVVWGQARNPGPLERRDPPWKRGPGSPGFSEETANLHRRWSASLFNC